MDPHHFRFVGYNCHLFDGIIGPVPKFNEAARRDSIGERLDGGRFDIVGLCEVWSDANKAVFIRRCQRSLPHSFTDSLAGRMGSGLLLLSRYPLLEPRFTPFATLAGMDSMTQKGVMQAVVAAPSGMFRVFLTHTQADDSTAELLHQLRHRVKKAARRLRSFRRDEPRAEEQASSVSAVVRALNLQQLREQIRSYHAELPAVVFGDLNVPDILPEYGAMMEQYFAGFLDAQLHLHPAAECVTYHPENPLVRRWNPSARHPMRLDYILCSANGDWSVKESAPLALKMPSGEDLSDHYAISACLKLEQRRSLRTY